MTLPPVPFQIDELELGPGLHEPTVRRACFMESLGTLHIPAIGYGIRYEHGIFDP